MTNYTMSNLGDWLEVGSKEMGTENNAKPTQS